MEESSEKKAWTFPPKSIDFWYQISVALALISAGAILPVMFYIFSAAGNSDLVDERVKLTTALGTSLGVLLTFSTVVWRGLVGEFQAREQKRANDAKDEENTTKLLLDGSKLITSIEQTDHEVGVAILRTVALKPFSNLHSPAINQLASYIVRNHSSDKFRLPVNAARTAMNDAACRGLFSGHFYDIHATKLSRLTQVYNGFDSTHYRNYLVTEDEYAQIISNGNVMFSYCKLLTIDWKSSETIAFHCNFVSCTFDTIDHVDLLENTFEACDFSNAIVHAPPDQRIFNRKQNVQLEKCFYYRDSPPTGDGAHLIIPYLEARDRPTT